MADRTSPQSINYARKRNHDINPLSLDQVIRILDTVRSDYRDYFTVLFFTGMRPCEIERLKWRSVDLAHGQILVSNTTSNDAVEHAITRGSQRVVQMSRIVSDALNNQKLATGHLSDYVFCNDHGNPLAPEYVTQCIWYPVLRDLNLAKRQLHQCRHTAATLWLASGECPRWIALQLGISSVEALFAIYARYVPNRRHREAAPYATLLLHATPIAPETILAEAANEPEINLIQQKDSQ